MSKLTEIKIDRKSLPNDGQKVKWQTFPDYNNDVWKEGVFAFDDEENEEDDGMFLVGFGPTHSYWDLSYKVHHWQPLE